MTKGRTIGYLRVGFGNFFLHDFVSGPKALPDIFFRKYGLARFFSSWYILNSVNIYNYFIVSLMSM